MTKKESQSKLRLLDKALREFPKIVKQKKKAYKEKAKVLRAFRSVTSKLPGRPKGSR